MSRNNKNRKENIEPFLKRKKNLIEKKDKLLREIEKVSSELMELSKTISSNCVHPDKYVVLDCEGVDDDYGRCEYYLDRFKCELCNTRSEAIRQETFYIMDNREKLYKEFTGRSTIKKSAWWKKVPVYIGEK